MFSTNNKKNSKIFWLSVTFGSLVIILLIAVIIYMLPGWQEVEPYPPSESPRLIYENKDKGTEPAIYENETIYLEKNFIKDKLDPYIHYDEGEEYITITTSNTVLNMQIEENSAFVNGEETKLDFPPKIQNDVPFLPEQILAKIYPVNIEYNSRDNLVILDHLTNPVLMGHIKEDESATLREEPSIRGGIIDELEESEKLYIYQEKEGWYYVRSNKGYLGFISDSQLELGEVSFRDTERIKKPSPPEVAMGEGINLTWEHVINKTPAPEDMPTLSGVNVISPTWFHLENSKGMLHDAGEKSFVEWAHDEGMEVWALFSNRFDPEMTHDFLRDPMARLKAANQIIEYARKYNLDGINFDFENMYYEDKDYYTQFVRELTPRLRQKGLVTSVDVTFISESENWSKVYDRQALSDTVDFVMVMAYDEHYSSSNTAGSVASLPWVRENLAEILDVVPNEQLILGIPFYTRLWEINAEGEVISSSAHGMEGINNILDKHDADVEYDEESEQYFSSYTTEDSKYKVWLETKESISKRLELIEEYDLAGVASWRRGFEKEEIWDLIDEELKRPSILD